MRVETIEFDFLEEAKIWGRISHNDDDELIKMLISSAVDYAELYLNKHLRFSTIYDDNNKIIATQGLKELPQGIKIWIIYYAIANYDGEDIESIKKRTLWMLAPFRNGRFL